VLRQLACARNGGEGRGDQRLVHLDGDPLAGAGKVDVPVVASVSVVAQQEHLGAQLGALGQVGPFGKVGRLATLVLDRDDISGGVALDDVDLRGDAQALGR
jgi:hypothetical protein